ncbi:MAG: hypothetical protein S4CHLAM102_06410 [Chlamydiia bacterium]|nr:hypothetical protein [Chlamydiia bacterium]
MKSWIFFLIVFPAAIFAARLPQKVVLCGVCKDIEEKLPHSVGYMKKIASFFDDAAICIYENNSSDQTRNILKEWQAEDNRVHLILEDVPQEVLESEIVNRVSGKLFVAERIARARNRVLDLIMSEAYSAYEYVIWMDMDFFRTPSYEGIIEVFESDREWDAVFANGVSPDKLFWDLYAYRDKDYFMGPELLGNSWWHQIQVIQRSGKFDWTDKDDWKSVISAFGGCGIYRKSALEGVRYSGLVTPDLAAVMKKMMEKYPFHKDVERYRSAIARMNEIRYLDASNVEPFPLCQNSRAGFVLANDPHRVIWVMNSFAYNFPSVCEHVTLHASMIEKGRDKLFINPRMVFRY